MSSFEAMAQARPNRSRWFSVAAASALAAALAMASGCQVRPLYANGGVDAAGEPTSTRSELSQIAIKPVTTRYGQEVRNHLIFLFGGGAGAPSASKYSMLLVVTALHETAAQVQVSGSDDNEPTAGSVTLKASYIVTNPTTGKAVASGSRQMTSSYDLPRQEFASLRAKRDAENRAARELAQMLQLAIAQDFSRR